MPLDVIRSPYYPIFYLPKGGYKGLGSVSGRTFHFLLQPNEECIVMILNPSKVVPNHKNGSNDFANETGRTATITIMSQTPKRATSTFSGLLSRSLQSANDKH